jgi:hypothetical protein
VAWRPLPQLPRIAEGNQASLDAVARARSQRVTVQANVPPQPSESTRRELTDAPREGRSLMVRMLGAPPRSVEVGVRHEPLSNLSGIAGRSPSSKAMTINGRRAAAGGRRAATTRRDERRIHSGHNVPSGLALRRATMASSQAAPAAPRNGT